MNTSYTVALSMLAASELVRPRCRPFMLKPRHPPIVFQEIQITDVDAYTKEFAPKAQAALKGAGGRFLAAGQKVTALEGEPPKTRVTIQVWESMEKMKAAYEFGEYKEARKIGDKYAKFRAFAVEGLPQ